MKTLANFFGPYSSRGSGQTLPRSRPQLDNQRFRASRGRGHHNARGKEIFRPLEGYWKKGNCEEAGCPFFNDGWVTTIDLTPLQDPKQLEERQYASRFLHQSGWDFRVEWDGSKEIFHFAPGQNVYPVIARSHRHLIPVQRDPVFLHRGGFGQRTTRMDYDQFLETYQEMSDGLNRRIQDG